MELTVVNAEQIPDDLPPGRYCCRLESMTWQEMKVRFVPGSQHQPGDCLIQLVKETPMVCINCRKPVEKRPGIWAPEVWAHPDDEDRANCPLPDWIPIMAEDAAPDDAERVIVLGPVN